MGLDEGNLQVMGGGVERYILTSSAVKVLLVSILRLDLVLYLRDSFRVPRRHPFIFI